MPPRPPVPGEAGPAWSRLRTFGKIITGKCRERSRADGGNVAAGAVPVSTYRLQLTPDFGFAQAAEVAGYLAALGVTHAYLSPVLEAVPGSRHGYDVTAP